MSPTTQPDPFPHVPDPLDSPANLASKVNTCVIQTDLARKEAGRAREAAEETLGLVKSMHTTMKGMAADHVWLRHGIPASWSGRFVLAAIGAIGGAIAATVISACSVRGSGR